MGIFKSIAKWLFPKREVTPLQVDSTTETEIHKVKPMRSISGARTKKATRKKYHRKRLYENTKINPINRHSSYGFALRRANKLERKPRGLRPPTLPTFFQYAT